MLRMFKSIGTNVEVTTIFKYISEANGEVLSYSADVHSPVKSAAGFENLYNRLSQRLENFKPNDKPCKLELLVKLNGKIQNHPCFKEFQDMQTFHAFLVERGMVSNKLKLVT